MLEAYVALAVCLAVSLGVRLYLRWFHSDVARQEAFERWCSEQPVVLAARCRPGTSRDVLDELRHLLGGGDPVRNHQGRFPWQHYAVELEQRTLGEDVVGLVITGCRLQKGERDYGDVERVVAGLRAVADRVDELWLHGQLHSAGRHLRFDRNRTGWLGTLSTGGELSVEPIIGQPPWLRIR